MRPFLSHFITSGGLDP